MALRANNRYLLEKLISVYSHFLLYPLSFWLVFLGIVPILLIWRSDKEWEESRPTILPSSSSDRKSFDTTSGFCLVDNILCLADLNTGNSCTSIWKPCTRPLSIHLTRSWSGCDRKRPSHAATNRGVWTVPIALGQLYMVLDGYPVSSDHWCICILMALWRSTLGS